LFILKSYNDGYNGVFYCLGILHEQRCVWYKRRLYHITRNQSDVWRGLFFVNIYLQQFIVLNKFDIFYSYIMHYAVFNENIVKSTVLAHNSHLNCTIGYEIHCFCFISVADWNLVCKWMVKQWISKKIKHRRIGTWQGHTGWWFTKSNILIWTCI
jgi:hypothetical protein